jgi:DNA integrity scanning protein DisA with diadenylate cyclase activity
MRRVLDTSCRLGARERVIGASGRLPTDGDGTVARSLPTRHYAAW